MSFGKLILFQQAKVPIFGRVSEGAVVPVPVRLAHPSIAADGQLGQGTILTATPGSWTDADTVTGQWQSALAASPDVYVNIGGATGLTHTLGAVLGDGNRYRYRETATNATGAAFGTSNSITLVGPVNSGAPVIAAVTTLKFGNNLQVANAGTWTGRGNVYTYQWRRNGVAIAGATNAIYTLAAADDVTTLTCTVTATNAIAAAGAVSNGIAFNDPLLLQSNLTGGLNWSLSGVMGDVQPQAANLTGGLNWSLSGVMGDVNTQTIAETGNFPFALEGWADIGTGGTQYQSAAQALTPVGHWPVNETSGTTALASVGGVNGTYTGVFTVNQGSPIDGGRSVNIAAGQAIISGLTNNAAFTVAGWVSPYYLSTTSQTLFSFTRAADLTDWAWRVTSGGTNTTEFFRVGFGGATSANITIPDRRYQTWVHLVVTYSSGVATLYLNGVQVGTVSTALRSIVGAAPYSFNIGGYASNPANSRFTQVSLFNRALTGGEVTTLFNAAGL